MVFEHVICYFIRQLATNTRISQDAAQSALDDMLKALHASLTQAFSPLFTAMDNAASLCSSALEASTEHHRRHLEEARCKVLEAFKQIDQP